MRLRGHVVITWIAAAILTRVSVGHAEGSRVVLLIDADAALEHAVTTALEPWGIDLRTRARPPAVGDVKRRASALASADGAAAVVWIAGVGADVTLWIYDADTGKTASLRLGAAPPFDDPTAAAVALSIKTLLRYSNVAPDSERIDVTAPDAGPQRLVIELNGVARGRDTGAMTIEGRFGLTASWFPRAAQGVLSLDARAVTGLGLAVDESAFAGQYSDTAVGVGVSLNGRVARALGLGLSTGISIHMTELDGIPLPLESKTVSRRINPSADGIAHLRVYLGSRVYAGLDVTAAYLLRRQRYFVGPDQVFELPSVEVGAGVSVGVVLM